MKNKVKRSEQILHEIVPLPFTELVKQIHENDKYLDNVEAKITKLQADTAVIEVAFARNGVKTAAKRVNLIQHDHLSTEVSVYPIESVSQARSWFLPIALMLILALVFGSSIRQDNTLGIVMGLLVMAIFTYLGARYLEENSGKTLLYNEEDDELLMNMLRLSLRPKVDEKRKTSELSQSDSAKIEPASPEAEISSAFRLEDVEAAKLDDETLQERKELYRKLDEL